MIYLASPYSDKDKRVVVSRYNEVLEFCANRIKEGHIVFSPIVHCHVMAQRFEMPGNHLFWWKYDTSMIDIADEVWILCLPYWQMSIGVGKEIAYAEKIGKKVRYFNPLGAEIS